MVKKCLVKNSKIELKERKQEETGKLDGRTRARNRFIDKIAEYWILTLPTAKEYWILRLFGLEYWILRFWGAEYWILAQVWWSQYSVWWPQSQAEFKTQWTFETRLLGEKSKSSDLWRSRDFCRSQGGRDGRFWIAGQKSVEKTQVCGITECF